MQVPVDAPFDGIRCALCGLFLRRNAASFLSRTKSWTAVGGLNSVTSQVESHANLMTVSDHTAVSGMHVALTMPDDLVTFDGLHHTIAILPYFVYELEDLVVWETATSYSQVAMDAGICTAVTDHIEQSNAVISFSTAGVRQIQKTSHHDEAVVIFAEFAHLSPSCLDIEKTCAYTVESTAKLFSPSTPSIKVNITRRPSHSDSFTFPNPCLIA